MDNLRTLMTIIVFAAISAAAFYVVQKRSNIKSLRDRLKNLDTSRRGVSLEEIEMSKPFSERIVIPFFSKIGRKLQMWTPKGVFARWARLLSAAGFSRTDPAAFLGMKTAAAALAGGAAAVFNLTVDKNYDRLLIEIMAAASLGMMIPDIVASAMAGKRKTEIQDALPDLLDILTVSVEAGLGFDQAISRAGAKIKGAISQEIKRMLHELRLGKKRSEALRSMSDRLGIHDLSSFCTAMIQADQLGVSISEVLRVQSDSIRQKRRQRSEERAMKAPLKMLFPLIFFIFPSLFIILLGPAFISIMENFKM